MHFAISIGNKLPATNWFIFLLDLGEWKDFLIVAGNRRRRNSLIKIQLLSINKSFVNHFSLTACQNQKTENYETFHFTKFTDGKISLFCRFIVSSKTERISLNITVLFDKIAEILFPKRIVKAESLRYQYAR